MIPKIIHWCWFGGNTVPEDVQNYVATWEKCCPDWDIIRWDESNFDVTQNAYCREAYEQKKWAFVADYARLKVLYDYGGFYLDSDVEMIKSLDVFRSYDAVSGYESERNIPTGTMGGAKHNEWIALLLKEYDRRHFLQPDGSVDMTTNTALITRLTVEVYGIRLTNQITKFGRDERMVLFPSDYFCAKDPDTEIIMKTANTYTIHHFKGTWLPEYMQRNRRFRDWCRKVFGSRYGELLFRAYHYIFVHKVGHVIHAWNKHVRGRKFDKY